MAVSIKNGGYAFLIRLDLMFFYVIMKGAPIITNFKQPIYQTFNLSGKLILYENDVKLFNIKRSPV